VTCSNTGETKTLVPERAWWYPKALVKRNTDLNTTPGVHSHTAIKWAPLIATPDQKPKTPGAFTDIISNWKSLFRPAK
jgi:hypothetical protein